MHTSHNFICVLKFKLVNHPLPLWISFLHDFISNEFLAKTYTYILSSHLLEQQKFFIWTFHLKIGILLIRYSLVAHLVKESTCITGDPGSIPGLGRSPGEGKGYPLLYSSLKNSMDCILIEISSFRKIFFFFFCLPYLRCYNIRKVTQLEWAGVLLRVPGNGTHLPSMCYSGTFRFVLQRPLSDLRS